MDEASAFAADGRRAGEERSIVRRGGLLALLLCLLMLGPTHATPGDDHDEMVVDFPQPAAFYQNTTFTLDGDVGYVPSKDLAKLWSFSTETGDLLDHDGLDLPEPGTASNAYLFADDRLAIPGWFPDQGILVADVSDPSDLTKIGVIDLPDDTNVQGQNVAVDDDGATGYVAGFPDDHLYAFNVSTLSLADGDGLALPGNPDRIARAGDRLAMVDTANGRIMVADVSDPSDLALAGTIDLPGHNVLGSDDDIVFAGDGETAFVSTNERVLYSFDVAQLELADPDGVSFGDQGLGLDIAIHGDVVACLSSKGLSFIDVSDPSDMALMADADFGEVLIQGSAQVAFSATGDAVAVPTISPDDLVYTFDVATGEQVAAPFPVSESPNYLTVYQPRNQVGVMCTMGEQIHLIEDLLGTTAYLPLVANRR